MTKEDIKKALEICTDDYHSCNGCPYYKVIDCSDTLRVNARELIVEQESEIERLKAEVKQAQIDILNKVKEKLEYCTGCYIPNCFESPTDDFAYDEKEVKRIIDELIEEIEK